MFLAKQNGNYHKLYIIGKVTKCSMFVRANKSVSNLTTGLKLLHCFIPVGLFFKIAWGVFNIFIGCFEFSYQNFIDKRYVGGHCRRSASKNRIPSHRFLRYYLGSVRSKFQGDGDPMRFHTLLC